MNASLRRYMRAARARFVPRPQGGFTSDSGGAIVEFLGLSIVLLIPLVYLVMVLARVQAASYAVDGAARDAGRVFALAESDEHARSRAHAAVTLAVTDQGFSSKASTLDVACTHANCLAPGESVTTTVTVRVPLPGVPAFARDVVPVEIPVRSSHVTIIDPLRASS